MLNRRILWAFNLSIAVFVIVFLALVYWFGFRTIPQMSGEINAPISAAGSISRDSLGIPHIQAASWEDAIFLQGYAMAQDRLWQMDGMRRRAAGELAEIAGRTALASDEEARRFRMRRLADLHEKSLLPEERVLFAAFARGVNQFISTHSDRLPVEFSILQYEPRPWTVRDSLLAGLEMYRFLTPNWRAEILKQQMLDKGDRDKVEFLFPLQTSGEAQPGSNAWAIAGTRTASSKPILANDPHLEFGIPSPWYLVHLQAPGLNVTGGSIVGLPAVIVGHNDRIAWGMTNLEFDVQDLYREEIDLATGRYMFDGKTEQAAAEQESIAIKGEPANESLIWVTRHGPIFATDSTPGQPQRSFSMRWSGAEQGGLTYPFLDINRAANWQEFTRALSRFGGPAQNFVYADIAGNIGYHASGRLPVRHVCKGDVPADGATGWCEWDGYVPFGDLPQEFNPSSGIIVTANQNPFPASVTFGINGNFAPPYRVNQIRQLLAAREKWRPQDMAGVQTDVYSAFHRFLAGELVAAYDRLKPTSPEVSEAVIQLRSWKGQMAKDQAAPMIVTLAYEELRKLAAENASPGTAGLYSARAAHPALEQLLRRRPKGWFPDYDQMLIRCLTSALEAGRKLQDVKIADWNFGRYQPLQIVSPVTGRIPLIGRFFNVGPFPMGSSPVSVMQYTGRLGPSLRMSVDLADLNHSFVSIPTGESANPLSSHYKDQWPAFYEGRTFPMPFGNVSATDVLRVTPK